MFVTILAAFIGCQSPTNFKFIQMQAPMVITDCSQAAAWVFNKAAEEHGCPDEYYSQIDNVFCSPKKPRPMSSNYPYFDVGRPAWM